MQVRFVKGRHGWARHAIDVRRGYPRVTTKVLYYLANHGFTEMKHDLQAEWDRLVVGERAAFNKMLASTGRLQAVFSRHGAPPLGLLEDGEAAKREWELRKADCASFARQHRVKLVDKREDYRGFACLWQEPPRTGIGWEINVASDDLELLNRMNDAMGEKGAKVIVGRSLEDALTQAKTFIDALFPA